MDDALALEERRLLVARLAGLDPIEVHLLARLVDDLHLTDITLFLLVVQLQQVNPHFVVPDQLPVESMTVHDLCHYSLVMGSEHVDV